MSPDRNSPYRLGPALAGAVVLGIALAGWTRSASARQNPPPAPKPAARSGDTGKKPEWAQISGKDLVHNDVTGEGSCYDFHYVEKDTTVTGTTLHYNDKKRIMDAEGNLVMEDPKHRVTGEKADVDYGTKKLAIITGNVVLTLKSDAPQKGGSGGAAPPAPGGKGTVGVAPIDVPGKPAPAPPAGDSSPDESVDKSRRRGGTATCDRLEDYYRKKFAILRGHLVFKQKFTDNDGKEVERTVTAEHGEYDSKKEILVLFAPVDVSDTKGEEMHFTGNLTIHTQEGAEALQSQGEYHGNVLLPEDESDTDNEPPSAPSASPAPTSSPANPSAAPSNPPAAPAKPVK